MRGLAKQPSLALWLCLLLWPLPSWAGNYAARISYAELIESGDHYQIAAHINYRLSPTALEALHKGVPLSWDVSIEVRCPGRLWDSVISRQVLAYRLQYHALLNQYSVSDGHQASPQTNDAEMFLSLNAALNFMARLDAAAEINTALLPAGQRYQLALRTRFNRERLPVPLRPVAYFDAEWFLSSNWLIWSIQK